jgi:hypothetical protein
MILSVLYKKGDLFILITGGVFVILGATSILNHYRKGEIISSLKVYEKLRGTKSAVFMGTFIFILFFILYAIFLFNYVKQFSF